MTTGKPIAMTGPNINKASYIEYDSDWNVVSYVIDSDDFDNIEDYFDELSSLNTSLSLTIRG